jgi:hypothetical protein
VTADEYLAAHRLGRKWALTWVNMSSAFIALIGLALLFTRAVTWGLIVFCAGIGGLVGEFVQSHFYLPRTVRRLHAQLKITTPVTYSWDAESLEVRSDSGHSQRK